MKINLKLFKNWVSSKDIYIIGKIFLKNGLYIKNIELIDIFNTCRTFDECLSFAKTINGFFSIIICKGNEAIIISDSLRLYPVFWTKKNAEIMISDSSYYLFNSIDIKKLVNTKIFTSLGYTTFKKTIFKDIYQNEPSSWIILSDKNDIEYGRYNNDFVSNKNYVSENKKFVKEYDIILNNIIMKTIVYLNGRKAIIPLSDGHDSRLIAFYLKKAGYNNILAYTYGRDILSKEVITSKRVAEYLGIEWHFVKYISKDMQKDFYNKELYNNIGNYCGNGISVPHIQDWYAISILKQKKIIDEHCVILPGHSGDFLAGSHLDFDFINKDLYTGKDIIDMIYKKHYVLNIIRNKKIINEIKDEIKSNYIIEYFEMFNKEDAINLYERFDLEERQVKLICNSVRIYEYYDLDWYLPLWDKENVKFWAKIPLEKRIYRKLFKEFANEKYSNLMKYAPIEEKNSIKNNNIIKNKSILYKILKFIWHIYCAFTNYYTDPINFYGYIKIFDYYKFISIKFNYHYYYYFSKYYVDNLRRMFNV